MGLYDRDYMKRPPDDDGGRSGSADEKLEAFFSGFLRRHPRLPIVLGVTFVVIIVLAILLAKLASKSG